MTCTKAALWVPNTNSLTHANLTRRQTSDIRRQYILRAMLRRSLLVLVLLPCTMKLPVMIQIFRDADAGLLGLDDSLPVHATFASLADGSPFDVDKADDSD